MSLMEKVLGLADVAKPLLDKVLEKVLAAEDQEAALKSILEHQAHSELLHEGLRREGKL